MRTRLGTLFSTLLLLSLPLAASAETCFTATIDGTQAGTGSPGTGTGLVVLNDAETELTFNITFSGLVGAETVAHFHSQAEGNGVVKTLPAGSPKIGKWTSVDAEPLTAQRVQDLKAGLIYINIHSTVNPGGEIRGQVLTGACNETCFDATIDGAQAGTGSGGTGTGTFVLNHTETELDFNIEFSGLTGAETVAHLHSQAEGNGVVKTLPVGSPKVGTWSFFDGESLTPARVADLKSELIYVNIHSTVNPGGEIRGQVLNTDCGSSSVPDRSATAATATLEQNAPNPFNPSTTIGFTLTRETRARLDVFDAGGRYVTTLADDVMPAGRALVQWDGRNARGGAGASGIYFYRLVAGDFTQTRKMVLLK